MKGDPILVSLLGLRMLPNADPILRKHLNLRPEDRSLGFLTTDCDDVSYTALDEATKKADVHVAYARSMYAGASNASTRLAGEFIGVLSGPDPEQVRAGLDAFLRTAVYLSLAPYAVHQRRGASAGGGVHLPLQREEGALFSGGQVPVVRLLPRPSPSAGAGAEGNAGGMTLHRP